jgi:hypothetical protein
MDTPAHECLRERVEPRAVSPGHAAQSADALELEALEQRETRA